MKHFKIKFVQIKLALGIMIPKNIIENFSDINENKSH